MRILVIGGTKFIGPYVVRRLFAQGHIVVLFHRGKSQTDLSPEIKHITGDRNRLEEFQNEFKRIKPDLVLDMIPVTQEHAQKLVRVFKGISKRIIAISSQDVYQAYGILIGTETGSVQKHSLTEDAPLRKKLYPYRQDKPRNQDDPQKILDDYDKILIEKTIMGEPSLAGTILRLPMVYGPGDYQHRVFEYLKRMDDQRSAIILEDGLANWRWTRGYVENVAEAIVLAIINERAMNRIYNVGEPDTLTTTEWVRMIGKVADWHGDVVIVPRAKLPSGMKTELRVEQHLVVDTKRIRKELGYHESIPLEHAVRQTIDWERQHHPEKIQADAFNYEAEDKVLEALRLKH